jgi:hypothetical protein
MIMCKCVGNVTDDLTFPWENAISRHPPNENPSIDTKFSTSDFVGEIAKES